MRTLTLRIYLTVVAVLLLFAFGSGWLFQRQIEQQRRDSETMTSDRMAAWGDLLQRSLPAPDAPAAEQAAALLDWSQRLRMPLALDSNRGVRIAASDSFVQRQADTGSPGFSVPLDDGRVLWVMRPGLRKGGPPGTRAGLRPPPSVPFLPAAWQQGVGPVIVLVLLFIAVSAG